MTRKLILLLVFMICSCAVKEDDNPEADEFDTLSNYKLVYRQSGNLDKDSPVLHIIADKTKMKNMVTNDVVESVLIDSDLNKTEYTFETIEKTSKFQLIYANEIEVATNPKETYSITISIQIFKDDQLIDEKTMYLDSSSTTNALNETY